MTKDECVVISQIAARAVPLFHKLGDAREHIDCVMDIEAVHDSLGLRLMPLLEAPDFDFAHDILGIARYLNRDTGELNGGFLPRYAE